MYSPIFPPAIGGPSTQCFNLCKALVQKQEVPIVVTYGQKFTLNEDNGFKVYTFRLRYTYTPADKALRWIIFPFFFVYILKKEKIDILHCHSVSVLSFLAAFISKFFGIPSIIKFAGDWVWETLSTYELQAKDFDEIYQKSALARFMTKVEKVGLNLFNKIWVVSEFRRENIKKLLGDDKKVFVINNCLLLKDGGSKNYKPEDPFVVVSANRFIPHKRLDLMVEIFSEADIPNSKLVLVGGGRKEEEDKIKNTIQRLSLGSRVFMKGILSTDKVYEEFKQSSIYISTSIEEGFPNVFIEAMNYGLPIITADAGGCREMVQDGKTGFVIDVYDRNGFINKLKQLFEDINMRQKMSENSFERSKSFNLEYKINDFLLVYKDLLSK